MKNKEYIVLEHEDKDKYSGEMYNIYIRDKNGFKYEQKLNRKEYADFILNEKVKNIKLYTQLISR